MALAMQWAATRPARNGGRFLTVNAGRNEANYQVRELAEHVAAAVPGTKVDITTAAPADSRSYRVDFSRSPELAPAHQPPQRPEKPPSAPPHCRTSTHPPPPA